MIQLTGTFQATVSLTGTFQATVSLTGSVDRFVTQMLGSQLDFSETANSGHLGSA
jgi:hypothetical protein